MAKQSNTTNSKLIALKAEADQLANNKKELEGLYALESKIDQLHYDRIETLEKQNKELEKSKKKYDSLLQQQKEQEKYLKAQLENFDEIEDSLLSIGNKLGKTSALYQTNADRARQVELTTQNISKLIATNTDLTGKQESAIIAATKAYGNTQVSIQNAGAALAKNTITQSQYNDAIKRSYEEFEDLIDAIDDSTESGKELLAILVAGRNEMESFAKAAEKSADRLQGANAALDAFGSSGIPLAGQMSDTFKSMANKDIPGVKAGLIALGAAAGALAANYFGAPMQVAIETYFDKQQNVIDGAKELARISNERGFIPQKIGLELSQSQIDNDNELNRLGKERDFAAQRAASQFSATMKSNAAEFQAASKTGLFGNSIGGVGYAAAQLQLAGVGADQIASAMSAAGDATGKMPTGKMGSDMAVMAARTGQSAEGIASINEAFQRMDGMSADTAMNMQEGLRSMAKQANINLGGLMSEMAESSKEMLGYQIKSGSALARQVTFARSMGVSFQDIAKAGQSMVLNYKDSIKSEMQLSAMLGKNVDLSEVRSSFAAGDTEGALKALKAQGLDPAKMDMFQQQQLQQATGMDLTTLSKISSNTGKSTTLGEGNAKAGNQSFLSRTQSAQQSLASQQAMISADQAIIDAKLSQKITEAYLTSDGYKKYQNSLADQQAAQAKLNTSIQAALLDSEAYQKAKADEKKLGIERTFGENALTTAGAIGGGGLMSLLQNKLLPKAAPAATAATQGGTGLMGSTGKFAKILPKMGKFAKGLGVVGTVLGAGLDFKNRKDEGQTNTQATAGTAGGVGGALAGAAAGAAIGSVVPIVGTAIGGIIGGALGAWGGGSLADLITGVGKKSEVKGQQKAQAKVQQKVAATAPAGAAGTTMAKPGNTSVATAAQASQKWIQTKLVQMNGNLGLIVNRTQATMANTANTTNQLKVLNTNTTALMNLTTRIEALTRATYEGSTVVKVDGKTIAKASNKYTENLQASNPTNNTGVIGAVTGGGR